ncbi:MAG: metabolite traffic protein EboE [Kiritimatiellia bacterium]
MQLKDGRHFSYCLNVHPGESLAELQETLRVQVPEIKQALSPEHPFGLGLRIAGEASAALTSAQALSGLQTQITEAGTYAFTVNGFPYGAFHRTRVKEQVYQPDWSSPLRLEYTRNLFDQLAALLPEDTQGSISSVPLGYKFTDTPFGMEFACRQLCQLTQHLHELELETGKLLHLGLEPEPDCILETTEEAVGFFKERLFRSGQVSEELLRRHLGICLDTCHVAMQFENPAEAVRTLRCEGIRISKTQISAALECEAEIDPEELKAFDDGVYLHQIKSSSGKSWRDLPEYLAHPDPRAGTLRIHAHVPLHWEGAEALWSTRHTLSDDFWKTLAASGCPHLEVETYTFHVLPDALRAGRSVAQDMIDECRWALEIL